MSGTANMKSPTDFIDPKEWREYVHCSVSSEEVPYTLAFGRTILFARFFEARNQTLALCFCVELADIVSLQEPERTRALETLNDRIFAEMTRFLATAVPPAPPESEDILSLPGGELVDAALNYLAKENSYFRLWEDYSEQAKRGGVLLSWQEFVISSSGPNSEDEMEFALLMRQLGNLLHYFRARNLALSPQCLSRIWFLHYLRGAERIAQTRVLVQSLLEAMSACASA